MAELDYLATIPGIPFPQIYETMMDWKTPIIAAIAYEAGVQVLSRIFGSSATSLSRVEAKKRGDKSTRKSNPLMTAFCLAHNMALCIYSAITFYNMVKGLHKARTRDAPLFDRVSYREETDYSGDRMKGVAERLFWWWKGICVCEVCCIPQSTNVSSTPSLLMFGEKGVWPRRVLLERHTCLLGISILSLKVLWNGGYNYHRAQRTSTIIPTTLPSCWRFDHHVGWNPLSLHSYLDVLHI